MNEEIWYWINTTSNTCTITLPASAEAGDQIVLVDYAKNMGNKQNYNRQQWFKLSRRC